MKSKFPWFYVVMLVVTLVAAVALAEATPDNPSGETTPWNNIQAVGPVWSALTLALVAVWQLLSYVVKAFVHQKTGKERRETGCVTEDIHNLCRETTKQRLDGIDKAIEAARIETKEARTENQTSFSRVFERLDDLAAVK